MKPAPDSKTAGCPHGAETAGGRCPACGQEEPILYWCEMCEKPMTDKRCPFCGLKTRKIRSPAAQSRGGA